MYSILCPPQIENSIVEIDESMFGKKRKYNRGRSRKQCWVFGMVERGSDNVLLKVVENRKKETLLPIITTHVNQSAKIYHDDWAAYRKLDIVGFKHGTVKHNVQFVSDTGVCTNTIEGLWGNVKGKIKGMHGLRQNKLQVVLDEIVFRYRHRRDMYHKYLEAITAMYKV